MKFLGRMRQSDDEKFLRPAGERTSEILDEIARTGGSLEREEAHDAEQQREDS